MGHCLFAKKIKIIIVIRVKGHPGSERQHLRKINTEDDEPNTLQAQWLVAH